MREITADAVLDAAFEWLCQQRRHYPADADVWDLRWRWMVEKPRLIRTLRANEYRFAPNQALRKNGETLHLWCARDTLVLKAMAMIIGPKLPISPRCTHIKGHGGLKGVIRWLLRALPRHRFVIRTDVKAYYEHIDHRQLLDLLDQHVAAHDVRRLLVQVVQRTVERGGLYRDIHRGIGRDSPLSPLLGALYLKPLDDALDRAGFQFVRYMDDILILTPTRWRCRKACRLLDQVLKQLDLSRHPDKTWIGRIDRGFDFLGYDHTRAGCRPAPDTRRRFLSGQLPHRGVPETLVALGVRRLAPEHRACPTTTRYELGDTVISEMATVVSVLDVVAVTSKSTPPTCIVRVVVDSKPSSGSLQS